MKSAFGLAGSLMGLVFACTAVAQQPSGAPAPAAAVPQATTQPATDDAGSLGARLELSPIVFDFGEVWQGSPAKGEFQVKNAGSDQLTLTVSSSCGCTVATKPKSPLEPGESGSFSITYDTKRIGPANKKVTVSSNDPTRPSVVIDVKGTVKPIFAATPNDCSFENAEETTVATRVIKLENQYPKPLPLRIKPGQNIEQYQFELKEVEAGKSYELTVTTKPPLTQGKNMTNLALETGMPDLPDVEVRLSADVRPRAQLSPIAVYVTPAKTKPWDTMLTVQYRADKPLKIVAVHSDLESVKCELMPQAEPQEGALVAYHQIRVNLPAFADIPTDGGKIIVETDDPDPKFAKLEAPITRREGRKRAQAIPTTQQSESAPAGPAVPAKGTVTPEARD